MAKVLINMTDEQKAKLQAQAERDNRSMTSYIINLIEQADKTINIPVIGTIKDDKIIFGKGE